MTGKTRRLMVIDAPTNLGLRPPAPGREPGVRRMPSALRGHGLVERLGAVDGGAVPAAPYDPAWDPATGTRNHDGIRDHTLALAERIGATLSGGQVPLVVGGDCSVLLGAALALRRQGRYGLAYVDGHLDFRHLGNSTHVEAVAGEDLAIVTGRGDDGLAAIEGLRPYVRDEDVVAIGNREFGLEAEGVAAEGIAVLDLPAVRAAGIPTVVATAVERFRASGVAGVWLHLDADVLDDAVMPAVDSRAPDGLSYAEMTDLVGGLLASGLVVGMEVTIYDPDLDEGGGIGAALVDHLVAVLADGLS